MQRGQARPKGWLFAHNHILLGKNTRQGVNGFGYFWIASREGSWKLIRCGWRPDLGPHYSKNLKQEVLKRLREKPPSHSSPRLAAGTAWHLHGRGSTPNLPGMRAPKQKTAGEKLWTWAGRDPAVPRRISRHRRGAPDAEAAEALAVEQFGLDGERRKRLVVSEQD